MEILAVFLLLIVILFLIISFLYFFSISRLNRKRTLDLYYKDLIRYKIKELDQLFNDFKNKNEFLQEEILNDIEDTIKNLIYVTLNKLKICYLSLEKENLLKFYFSKNKFKNKLKEIDKLQFDYKITYAKIKFKINEYNLINEIKENLILELDQLFKKFINLVKISEFQKDLLQGKYLERINKIEYKIIKIKEEKNDLDDFINKIKKINSEILELNNDFVFYLKIKNKIDSFYLNIKTKIKQLINENSQFIKKYYKNLQAKIKDIKYDFAKLKIHLFNLNFLYARKINQKILDKLNLMFFDYQTVFNQTEFILKEEKNLFWFMRNISNFDNLIKYKFSNFINDDKLKISYLNYLKKEIIDKFNAYKKYQDENILHRKIIVKKVDQLILISSYLKKYQQIFFLKDSIEKENKFMKKFNNLNFIFINIENLYYQIPDKYQKKYKDKIIKIKESFKLFSSEIKILKSFEIKEKYLKLENELNIFYQKIFRDTFLILYLNEIISSLNKYHSNQKISFIENKIEKYYQNDNLIDALKVIYRTIVI